MRLEVRVLLMSICLRYYEWYGGALAGYNSQ